MSRDKLGDDILVELSDEEIEESREFYKKLDRVEFVYVHLYLKNQLRWNQQMKRMSEDEVMEISDRCKMRFFRPRDGRNEHKTLIGITGDDEYTIFIVTLDESLLELRQSLEQTSVIKWEKTPMFVAVHRRYHKMMYEIFETKNVRVRLDNYCSTIWISKTKGTNFDFSIPDGAELRELKDDEAKLINEAWPYKYPGSEKFIRSLIHLNSGFGIYENQKLVSWILQVECFGLGLLQTLDDYQGKGYARILTRAMTKRISKELDEDVILFASYSRPKTVDLYIRYGFKHVSYTHWLYLRKA